MRHPGRRVDIFAAPPGWRTPGEVAELLGLSLSSVMGHLYRGKTLVGVMQRSGLVFVRETSVVRFVAERARW